MKTENQIREELERLEPLLATQGDGGFGGLITNAITTSRWKALMWVLCSSKESLNNEG